MNVRVCVSVCKGACVRVCVNVRVAAAEGLKGPKSAYRVNCPQIAEQPRMTPGARIPASL